MTSWKRGDSIQLAAVEAAIVKAALLIVAVGSLSYLPLVGRLSYPIGPLLLYGLSALAFIYVVWLAILEGSIRVPRSTIVLPILLFFLVLSFSALTPRPPVGPVGTGASSGESALYSALPAFAFYLGYVYVDSRRERRRALVVVSFILTTAIIVDALRMALASLGAGWAGGASLSLNNAAEAGLYLSFVLPLLAAQVAVRKGWFSRTAFALPLVAGGAFAIAALPRFAVLAIVIGVALAIALDRGGASLAAPALIATILATAVLVGGDVPMGGWPRVGVAQTAKEAEAAIALLGGHISKPTGPAAGAMISMGAAAILFLLTLLSALFMQGVPSLAGKSDAEKAFAIGILAGAGSYAIVSVIYGSSAVASPAVWFLVGTGARLINPLAEPVLSLHLVRSSDIGEAVE